MHRLRQAASTLLLAALAAGLGGCNRGDLIDSASGLFHDVEGGLVAQQRPPPPGVDDPYPNLSSIPARPAAPDIAAQQKLADQLAAQRDQAEQQAAADPLTPRVTPPVSKPEIAKPPDPNANRVVVDTAASPPAAAAKPTPKAAAVATATPPATPATAATATAGPSLSLVPPVAAALVAGPLPTLAAAPPAAPSGLGVVTAPTATTASTTAAMATAAVPVVATTPSDKLVTVAFTSGSAVLPPSAYLTLRKFALAHKGVPVTITGHGEAVLPGADSQSRALDLGLRRAEAIAASLGTAGVPAVNLRLRAEATGQGGSASL